MARSTPEPQPVPEISQGPSALDRFLEKNQKLLFVLGVLLALAALAMVIKRNLDRAHNAEAGNALSEAQDLAAVQSVMKKYGKTLAAPTAAVILSDKQWEQGQQSEAIETLRQEIDTHPKHPATIPAQARLAARYQAQGDLAKAKELFQQLLDNPDASWVAPFAMASLAEISAKDGDGAKAEKLLQQALEQYPVNPFNSVVQLWQRFVNFTPPTEIDAPPVEELPATTPSIIDPGSVGEPDEPDSEDSGEANPMLDIMGGGQPTTEPAAPEDSTETQEPVPGQAAPDEQPTPDQSGQEESDPKE